MGEEHYLEIRKSARYYLSGSLKHHYRAVCFVLHGYGQLARFFIRPFINEQWKDILFVAPEGLHRFYLSGAQGRVGASWMTKEDRLRDIEDYCAYLDQLRGHMMSQVHLADPHSIGVLGFSQGVATACRWLSSSRYSFDYLINYAGLYPQDLPESNALERMQKIPVRHLLGDRDEHISLERMEETLTEFAKYGYPNQLKIFSGGHKIYQEPLAEIFSDLGLLT
jgi:predicted esterase